MKKIVITVLLSLLASIQAKDLGIIRENIDSVTLNEIRSMVAKEDFGRTVQTKGFVFFTKVNFRIYETEAEVIERKNGLILGFDVPEDLYVDTILDAMKTNPAECIVQGFLEDHRSIGMGIVFTATYFHPISQTSNK